MSKLNGFRCNRCKHFIVEEDVDKYGSYRMPNGWVQYMSDNDLSYKHLCESCVKQLELK